MEFEFDPDKDLANSRKHGLSLSDATDFELRTAVIRVDDRRDYGEVRYRAFGRIAGLGYCLAFTARPGALRLISFRRAHEKEMRSHDR